LALESFEPLSSELCDGDYDKLIVEEVYKAKEIDEDTYQATEVKGINPIVNHILTETGHCYSVRLHNTAERRSTASRPTATNGNGNSRRFTGF